MKKHSKIFEYLQTALLLLLFMLTLSLAAVYMALTQGLSFTPDIDIPIGTLRMLSSDSAVSDNTDLIRNQLLPEMIAYSYDDNLRAVCETGQMSDFYSEIAEEYIGVLFGEKAVCTQLDDSAGGKMWDEGFERDHIYIRYHNEMLFPIIYTFLQDEIGKACASGDVAYVRDIVVYYDQSIENIAAVSRDNSGRYASFKLVDKSEVYNITDLLAYNNNKEFSDCNYYTDISDLTSFENIALDKRTLFFGEFEIASIGEYHMENPSGDHNDKLIELFDYNPDNVNKYSGAAAQSAYVEQHGVLRVDLYSEIEYTASNNGGISLSRYLGYGVYGGEYTLAETIRGCGILLARLRELNAGWLGGGAKPLLYDVYRENNLTKIRYIYTYNNIRLCDADADPIIAAEISVGGDKIQNITIDSRNIVVNSAGAFSFSVMRTMMNIDRNRTAVDSGNNSKAVLIYKLGSEEQNLPQWVYVSGGEQKEGENELE